MSNQRTNMLDPSCRSSQEDLHDRNQSLPDLQELDDYYFNELENQYNSSDDLMDMEPPSPNSQMDLSENEDTPSPNYQMDVSDNEDSDHEDSDHEDSDNEDCTPSPNSQMDLSENEDHIISSPLSANIPTGNSKTSASKGDLTKIYLLASAPETPVSISCTATDGRPIATRKKLQTRQSQLDAIPEEGEEDVGDFNDVLLKSPCRGRLESSNRWLKDCSFSFEMNTCLTPSSRSLKRNLSQLQETHTILRRSKCEKDQLEHLESPPASRRRHHSPVWLHITESECAEQVDQADFIGAKTKSEKNQLDHSNSPSTSQCCLPLDSQNTQSKCVDKVSQLDFTSAKEIVDETNSEENQLQNSEMPPVSQIRHHSPVQSDNSQPEHADRSDQSDSSGAAKPPDESKTENTRLEHLESTRTSLGWAHSPIQTHATHSEHVDQFNLSDLIGAETVQDPIHTPAARNRTATDGRPIATRKKLRTRQSQLDVIPEEGGGNVGDSNDVILKSPRRGQLESSTQWLKDHSFSFEMDTRPTPSSRSLKRNISQLQETNSILRGSKSAKHQFESLELPPTSRRRHHPPVQSHNSQSEYTNQSDQSNSIHEEREGPLERRWSQNLGQHFYVLRRSDSALHQPQYKELPDTSEKRCQSPAGVITKSTNDLLSIQQSGIIDLKPLTLNHAVLATQRIGNDNQLSAKNNETQQSGSPKSITEDDEHESTKISDVQLRTISSTIIGQDKSSRSTYQHLTKASLPDCTNPIASENPMVSTELPCRTLQEDNFGRFRTFLVKKDHKKSIDAYADMDILWCFITASNSANSKSDSLRHRSVLHSTPHRNINQLNTPSEVYLHPPKENMLEREGQELVSDQSQMLESLGKRVDLNVQVTSPQNQSPPNTEWSNANKTTPHDGPIAFKFADAEAVVKLLVPVAEKSGLRKQSNSPTVSTETDFLISPARMEENTISRNQPMHDHPEDQNHQPIAQE
ncbi:uncharacterized protein MELLADRAFT_86538 [Melampsora larici-populina 98AG31]|uniref:Uncharacterized protein n=1 Tax=Melampsora larici-populina (strain 98AG31 / pathotype 3-4-7) TaxID=747676 RepID=F4RM62_MELLP|nr:uncharacterized protein MELLADRAFT_86538 [Melampsora larici-populina 98AG31]EGG06524.1 hypothetical protein MELLADRAFT_86538 [Melampsora larici-populina 98AG31]